MKRISTYSIMKKEVYIVLVFVFDDEEEQRERASRKGWTRPWISRRQSERAIEQFN